MIKRFLFLLLPVLLLIPITLSAQDSGITWLGGDGISAPIHLRFQLGDFTYKTVQTPRGPELIVLAKGGTAILKAGAPDLPKFSGSVIIPDLTSFQVEVISSHETTVPNRIIAPSKGNITRDIDPATISRLRGAVYQQNDWFPESIAELRKPHILADFRGQTVVFFPFQYNALSQTLRITDHIEVLLRPVSGIAPQNPFIRTNETQLHNSRQDVYAKHFLNYSSERYTAIDEQQRMLIITDPVFQPALDSFILWKRQSGMFVEVLTLAEAGGNIVGINNAVRSRYLSSGLSYVLLVGDINQIPSPTVAGGKSDPSYGFVLGDDAYPEVMIGRFSAETIEQVYTQVNKVIQYEKAAMSMNHLSHFLSMASNQGPGDDNELDWEHERVMRNKLSAYTYDFAYEQFDGDQGELDPPGNPNASNVVDILNQGIGLIIYTGHGSAVSFGTSGFSNVEINQLQNDGMLPFIWSVGCVNGEFDNGTCFGETWMRATRNGQPTGAVAAFMSSINQSWDPPMSAQDEMVDLLTGLVQTTNTRTFGGLSLNGCLKMNDEYGSAGDEMTSTWHIFGDPSMMVRTAVPLAMSVNHAPTTALGSNGFMVQADVEEARVAISQNGMLLGTALIQGGQAWISFNPLVLMDPLLVTVTAFNRIPYQGQVIINTPENAFLLLSNHQLQELSGNGDQLAGSGEQLQFTATIENVGGSAAGLVSGTMTTSDTFITITSANCQFGSVGVGLSAVSEGCFSFSVSNDATDQAIVHFLLSFSDSLGNTWSQPVSVVIQAPVLQTHNVLITELSGNGNGRPDAGETMQVSIPNINTGHASTLIGLGALSGDLSEMTFLPLTQAVPFVDSGSQTDVVFSITIAPTVDAGSYLTVSYTWNAGEYSTSRDFILHVGSLVEDAESGDFLKYAWQSDGTSPWTIDNQMVFEGSNSFRSGVVDNNGFSDLSIQYHVSSSDTLRFMKRVSSEEGYDFLKFYLDGTLLQSWSGMIDWSEEKMVISAGAHEFRWVYEKDEMIADNDDAAWIDYIVFPMGDGAANAMPTPASDLASEYTIIPNPVGLQGFFLRGNQLQVGVYEFRLLDVTGRCIEQRSVKNSAGTSQWEWNISNQAAGLYFLQIHAPAAVSRTIRLVKQ